MAKSAIAVLLACVALAGCGTRQPLTGQQWAERTRLSDDVMSPFVVLISPEVQVPNLMMGGTTDLTVKLMATVDKKTAAVRWLVDGRVRHHGSTWVFPSGARFMDTEGNARTATKFSRDKGDVACYRGGCSFDEGATFEVPADVVMGWAKAPAEKLWLIRFDSGSGFMEKLVPQPQVQAFVARVQAQQIEAIKAVGAKTS